MSLSDQQWNERQRLLLLRAQEAAERGDAYEAIEAVFASGTLDNVFRLVRSKFSGLPFEDISDSIAEALKSYIFALRQAKTIRDPKAYIYKAAVNNAIDLANDRARWSELTDDIPDLRSSAASQDSPNRQLIRSEAVRLARQIIERLGLTRVREVMSYIIEAISQGAEEVTNDEIAEALHISKGTVKVNRSRGFERLAKEAESMGFNLDIRDLRATYGEEDVTDEDEQVEDSNDD